MSSPVALITGASSGIGLALTQHLLRKNYHVVMADMNWPPASAQLSATRTLFIKTDVSSWDAQASLFSKAFNWHSRLDFAALNAGIDDRDDIFNSISRSAYSPPQKPNMATFDVDLYGVYYGIKLFAHYAALNPVPGGRIVITASAAGLYALPAVPQYSAAKHALVGLTRSLAPGAAAHNITVNCICPAAVPTGLAPPGLMERFPKEHITPMSTILRAFDELMDEKANRNGECVEAAVQDLFYRTPPEPMGESQKWMKKGAAEFWTEAYRERNVGFVNAKRSKL